MDSIRTTISLNGAVYLFMCGVGLITPMLPGKIYNLSQSAVHVGILAAAFAFSYVIIQIPMGILADRFGYKKFIVLGYVLCGLAGLLYLQASSPSVLIVGRVIQGLGEAPLWALLPAILSLINTKKKGREIGWYNGAIHLGLTSGSLLGFLELKFFSEGSIFLIYVLFCFPSAVWVLFGVREASMLPPRTAGNKKQNYREKFDLLKQPTIFVVLKGITLYGVGYGVFMTIIPTYVSHSGSFTSDFTGLIFIAFYLGITLAQFIGGPVSDNIGRDSKGFVSGLFYFFWGCGYFFGPVIMGYMSDMGLITYGFKAIGGLGIITALFIFQLCRSSKHHVTFD